MALDDENDSGSTYQNPNTTGLTNVNPDAPDFVKDIQVKKKGVPVDMNINFVPNNPFTMTVDSKSLGQSELVTGKPKESAGFIASTKAEFKNFNTPYQAYSAASSQIQQAGVFDDIPPAGWTPTTDQDKFVNIDPKYYNYLLDAKGPKDQDLRLQKIYSEQDQDETLANGSLLGKVQGGLYGIALDPTNLIPIAGWVKYAKFAPTILRSMGRALPGVATSSVIQAGAEEANKVNRNMHDFVMDTFTRTVFGSVLFGAGGALGLTAEKSAVWELKGLAKQSMDGIDFRLATDKEGKVTGIKAFETKESENAMKVDWAQDIANSTFSKSGLFKIPYLNTAATKFLSNGWVGSPLMRMLNSSYKTTSAFIDRVASHSVITKGVQEGEASPTKFADLMAQERGQLGALQAQVNALHIERNGLKTRNRPLNGLMNLGLHLQDKSLKLLGKDLENNGYVSMENFHSEIEDVLVHERTSNHAAVNEAASMFRKQMDTTYDAYRQAYNLPKDWMPPKTAQGYLMRVYDTQYMASHENEWTEAVSGWLKEADQTISNRMAPINNLSSSIKKFEAAHTDAVHILANMDAKRLDSDAQSIASLEHGTTIHIPRESEKSIRPLANELIPGSPVHSLSQMRSRLRAMKEELQNDLRSNQDLALHVHDWNAVSANEAMEIKILTKKLDGIAKEITKQKQVIAQAKTEASRKLSSAKNTGTIKKAIPKSKRFVESKSQVAIEEEKLRDLQDKHLAEQDNLNMKIHSGEVNPRLYTKEKDAFIYHLKNPNERLRFREVHESHAAREKAAKAYYNTIMNQTPEHTIAQTMGKFTGNQSENHIKQRTLLIPDEVLYKNGFMSKDVMAKVSNYTTYLARRTHLKNVFKDVSHEGGIEPVLTHLTEEHEAKRLELNKKRADIQQKLNTDDLSTDEKKALQKQLKKSEKALQKDKEDFDSNKKDINHVYNKMMGINNVGPTARNIKSAVMSITAFANLPFVPFTMINDLSAIGLQHGVWPFIRDGVAPAITSIAGLLKTEGSESLRKTAPSVHLALQDVLNGYANRNWNEMNNPYLNLGRITHGLEKIAHASANFTGTNFLDNGLQHLTGAVAQSEFMRILHAFKDGTMSSRDERYMLKYGIKPSEWADRMIDAYKTKGGGKTALGGYQSRFYHWEDLEASNKFGDSVYRAVKDTQIQSGIADSPFWQDANSDWGILGEIIKGFNGWTFASLNRYVIPSLQQPDAQKLIGVTFMLATGALISPMRRMARGENPYPDNVTNSQIFWQTVQDSGYFSYFANAMEDANIISGGKLLGDLRNDKYRDRTRTGLLGPAMGTANRMADIIGALGSGEMNEADALKMARMIPFANASWTFWMSKMLVDHLGLPKTRAQAHALKAIS